MGHVKTTRGVAVVKELGERGRRGKKGIVEALQYAIGHHVRVQILIMLNEGAFTSQEIADEIGVHINTVGNHLRRMLEEGSIEIADKRELRNNVTQYWYKAVEVQTYSVEDFEKLPLPYRQNIVGAISQSGMAEVVAGLASGKLADPRAHVFWDWFNLDVQGRGEADELTERYIEDMRALEGEAANRVAMTGEETVSMLLNCSFFERARKGVKRSLRPVSTKSRT
jgi:predicted ArsR family transcriptional regulator